jgi:hypothetical protein
LVNQGKGSLFKRKDDKYFIYLPKNMVEDTAFPFSTEPSVKVNVHFTEDKKIIIESRA